MRFIYLQHIPYRHLSREIRNAFPGSVYNHCLFQRSGAEPRARRHPRGTRRIDARRPRRLRCRGIDRAQQEVRRAWTRTPISAQPSSRIRSAPKTLNTGDLIVGRSLGKAREPLRVAEELAWLDNLSAGRLMTGFPVGLAYDANINAGIPPIETRARYDENLSLRAEGMDRPRTVKPAWNGKYSQYMSVNIWPRPFQTPHPPVSITGTGIQTPPDSPCSGTSDSTSLSSAVPRQPPNAYLTICGGWLMNSAWTIIRSGPTTLSMFWSLTPIARRSGLLQNTLPTA